MGKKILVLLIVAFLSLNLGMGLKSYAGRSKVKQEQDLLAGGQVENKVKEALNQVGAGGHGNENLLTADEIKALAEDISIQACQMAIAQFDDGEKTATKDKADDFLYMLLKGDLIDIGGLPEIEGLN